MGVSLFKMTNDEIVADMSDYSMGTGVGRYVGQKLDETNPIRYVHSQPIILPRRTLTASIFLPSVPNLLLLASEMEAQRNHILGKPHRETLDDPLDAELAEQNRDEPGSTLR